MIITATQNSGSENFDLIIAGAGPCGLYAAVCAGIAGLRTLVVEQHSEPHRHSRSIGIHPPSLSLLRDAGLLDEFLKNGTKISTGQARYEPAGSLGLLPLAAPDLHPPYILTIPQWKNESLLENRLKAFSHVQLVRGVRVAGIAQPASGVPGDEPDMQVTLTGRMKSQVYGRFLLACDGKHSPVRNMAGIAVNHHRYAQRYAMGDFPDTSSFGNEAVIFLSRTGLVECFPLPGALRRWVIEQPHHGVADSAQTLAHIVRERCNVTLDTGQCCMFSEFGVEKQLAHAFHAGRVVLAGDSAHVTSPIGGQGMNLGWINTALATKLIDGIIKGRLSAPEALNTYQRMARRRARQVIARAEFNMRLGGRSALSPLRNALVWTLLHTPAASVLRNRFTMRGL